MAYKLKFGILQDLDAELPYITNIKDRFEHAYIIGKTGTGKSVLMEHMANYDINYGLSTIFIDPKGESCRRLYELAPDKSKIKYISVKQPMVINPLNKEGYDIDDIIAEFVQILDILIQLTASNPESTVLMREIIGMALHSFNKKQKNLQYLVDFLWYEDVRKEHIIKLKEEQKDERYIHYWTEFDAKENRYPKNKDKIESAKRVASRLQEISTGKMEDIVQGENELYIHDIIAKGQSLLVDTSRMSRTSRIYLSNLIVYSVLSYCEYHAGIDKPLMVYVDELSTVMSPLFIELMARSRGKKVGFVLAHQNVSQIKPQEVNGIMGNTHTYVCFNCGYEEAERFSPYLNVPPKDLINLGKFNAWVRIGTKCSPIKTFKPLIKEIPVLPEEIEKFEEPFKAEEPLAENTHEEPAYNFLSNDWIVV